MLWPTVSKIGLARPLALYAAPIFRMNDVGEVFDHPQVRARKRLLEVSVPGGAVQLPRMPFNIQGVEEDDGAVPAVGQHTDAILAELGYGELEIESMHAAGAV